MGRQWHGLGIAAALLLAACSAQPDPEAEQPPPKAQAPAQPMSVFAAMRQGAAGWAADEVRAEQDSLARTLEQGYQPAEAFDLFSCSEPDAELGEVDRRTRALARLAHRIVLMEARLKAVGYGPGIWQEAVASLEAQSLGLLEQGVPEWGTPAGDAQEEALAGLMRQAAATMELRRQALQPETPPIINEGGCGAFETPFIVKADPPDGRIWLTTRFAFQTCQAQGKPAWDLAQCRWTEATGDRPLELAGNYMVQARWPDGRTLRSAQRFQSDPASDSEEPVTIAIRPG
jgi:hypothetical protein